MVNKAFISPKFMQKTNKFWSKSLYNWTLLYLSIPIASVQTDLAKNVWTRAYQIPERNRTVRRQEFCLFICFLHELGIINILQTNRIWKWPIDFMQQHLIDKSMEKKYEFLSLLNAENRVHVQLFFYMRKKARILFIYLFFAWTWGK
jgi:hypothetical protein